MSFEGLLVLIRSRTTPPAHGVRMMVHVMVAREHGASAYPQAFAAVKRPGFDALLDPGWSSARRQTLLEMQEDCSLSRLRKFDAQQRNGSPENGACSSVPASDVLLDTDESRV